MRQTHRARRREPRSSAMRTLVSRIVVHRKGARRASICSPMSGDIGVDAGDPAQRVREQELVMVGEMPVERSGPTHFAVCFTWVRVDLGYGSTADQGRTGREVSSSRLWRPARALGTHAKRGPSTGHSAVGLRQAGNTLLTPRPHFTAHHARLVTRWFVLRTALLFVRSAVRLVSAELPGPVAVRLPKQVLRELGDRVLGGDRIVEHRRVQRAPPPPPLTTPPSHPRHGLPGPTQSKPRHPH